MDQAPSSPASPTSSPSSSSKLRLLCSYGGRIVPRPHDKTLCYAGGESRLLAFDRRTAISSLASLTSHISRSLLNGRPFSLKYQLPDHDLDSLVSVATDEDLVNMVDEYDRAAISPNPTRLRFFLFPPASSSKGADPSSPAGSDYDPKSEAWFFDALKSAGIAVNEKKSSELELGGGDGAAESEAKELDLSAGLAEGVGPTRSTPASLPTVKVYGGEDKTGCLSQDFSPAAYSLVDSPESDSSATSPNFKSPTLVYLDSLSTHSDQIDSKLFTTPNPNPMDSTDLSPTDHMSSVQAYGYTFSQAMDQLHSQSTLQSYQQQPLQPQYIHAHPQYVPQYYSTMSPFSAQYQPYLQQQQQQQQQQHQQPAYQMSKPYPVYLMHVGQDLSPTQLLPKAPMNMNRMVASPVGLGPPAKSPEIATKVYRPGPTISQPISVPSAQMGQAAVDASGFEFDDPILHPQIYKTQAPRQTAMLFDNLTKLQLDTTK